MPDVPEGIDRPPTAALRSAVERIAGWSASHPRGVVAAALLLAVLSAGAVCRLELRGGIYELFPARPGPIDDLVRFARTFGSARELLILVTGERPAEVRRTADWLRGRLRQSPLLEDVAGDPATADPAGVMRHLGQHVFALIDDARWPAARRRLTDELDQRVEALRKLLLAPVAPDRALVVADPLGLLRDDLVAGSRGPGFAEGSAAAAGRAEVVVARPRGSPADLDFCAALDRELARLLALRPGRGDGASGEPVVDVGLTGAYRYPLLFARLLRRDLLLSSLLALLGCSLVFVVLFRTLRLLPVTLGIGALAVLLTLAVAALTVGRLNALSLSFAAICIGLGVDAAIHVLCRARELGTAIGPGERARRALSDVAPALTAASLTTLLAFASFSLSDFAGLSHTGLLASCGIAASVALTVILLPALMVVADARRTAHARRPLASDGLDRGLAWLVRAVTSRRGAAVVLGAYGLATVAAGLHAGQLRVEGSLDAAVPANLPAAAVDRDLARAFGRDGHRMIVLASAPDPERALQLNDRVARELERLRGDGVIADFQGIADPLPSRATQRRRLERLHQLDPERIAARLRSALVRHGLRPEAFAGFFRALADPLTIDRDQLPGPLRAVVDRHLRPAATPAGETLVATFVHATPGAQARATARLRAALDDLTRVAGPGAGRVGLTGAAVVGPAMARVLERDLLLVGGATVLVVLVVLVALLRRAWPVAATCISLLVAGLLFCALLPLLGLRIDVYTLLTIPIVIGYGVDDHIYVVRRAATDGIERAGALSGRAVVATTLTSGAAFGALGVCQTDGLRHLGLAAAVGLGLGLLNSLLLLPALLSLGARRDRDR